jgi:hypothetical protein
MENLKVETTPSEDNDGMVDEFGFVVTHRNEFIQIPQPFEHDDQEGQELTVRERLVLSFNRHPVIETALGSAALTSLGFVLGGAIFTHRRHSLRQA